MIFFLKVFGKIYKKFSKKEKKELTALKEKVDPRKTKEVDPQNKKKGHKKRYKGETKHGRTALLAPCFVEALYEKERRAQRAFLP